MFMFIDNVWGLKSIKKKIKKITFICLDSIKEQKIKYKNIFINIFKIVRKSFKKM